MKSEPGTPLQDWARHFAESLANGAGAPALLTVASCSTPATARQVVVAVHRLATEAGWAVYDVDAADATGPGVLQERGVCVLHLTDRPMSNALIAMVAGFQHLIRRGLPVALVVVGTPSGVRVLRRHAALGWLARSEPLNC